MPRSTSARSTVGAGDALLAGFLASGRPGEAALAEALAVGRGGGRAARQPHAGAGDIDGRLATVRRDVDRHQLDSPT